MISPMQLLALEAHARATGDAPILAMVRDARAGDPAGAAACASNLEMIEMMGQRICVLVTQDAATTIPGSEVDALAAAIDPAMHRRDWPAISLLRRLAPEHEALARLDRIAREHGYARSGSDDRSAEGEACDAAAVDDDISGGQP